MSQLLLLLFHIFLEEKSLDETFDFGDGNSPVSAGEDSNEESTDVSTNDA